jgi:outer membrane receptor protein involved in Fe transport
LALGATILVVAAIARANNPAEVFELPTLEVIGTTPLPGLGTALKDVPANVQTFSARDLTRQRPLDLTQFLDRNANSVGVGSPQGSPFQQDLSFRGFSASPLLGTPQGISVFQDGVRVNEAFGDVVNWDLLPRSAISSVQLIPGSNPVFGLNTIGGALAIYTKSGAQYPGAAIEVSAGSFRRKTAQFEYGGKAGRMDYFATGNYSDDGGWADHNPGRVKQFFGKIGYQDDVSDLDLSVTLADNTLQGTQTLPLSFLDAPRQAYTYPDTNRNRLAFFAAKGSRFLGENVLLGGNAYYRRYRNDNTSSNVNDRFGELDPETGLAQTNEATNDHSTTDQRSWGIGLQLTVLGELAGRKNQFIVGVGGDFGDTSFGQRSQPAMFTVERNTVAAGEFLPITDVDATNAYLGTFFADTFSLDDRWTLSLSGRYNRARVRIVDRSGQDSELDGSHTFARLNSAVGVNFHPSSALTAYAAYNEGMRAPSPIELTCSDANAPCKLPNVFVADPPLRKVVSRTAEAGARGTLASETRWSGAIYRTDIDDDIQFIASGAGASNSGFFQNVGKTRRDGIEVAGSTRIGNLELALHYSHIAATFRSSFLAASPNNSSADDAGAIVVRPGDRIPGIPRDSVKVRADMDVSPLSIGGSLAYNSGQYAHGDENNRDVNGRVPGYTVVDFDARLRIDPRLQVFAQVSNVFDRRYQNFAILGSNVFNGPNRSFGPALGVPPDATQFRGVGAPRGVWFGIRYALDNTGHDN